MKDYAGGKTGQCKNDKTTPNHTDQILKSLKKDQKQNDKSQKILNYKRTF